MQAEIIEGENFMSWPKIVFDNFEPGLTLIDGPNGVGKSSIWDIPSWCCFGETTRGVKNDAVVNRRTKKDCYGRFVFSNRGDRFDVRRYRNHRGTDASGKKFGNRLLVYWTPAGAEERLVEKGTVADTQKWLLEKLEIDFQLYGCTVVHGQADSFNFVNETDKNQKEILSKVRRIDFSNPLTKVRETLRNTQTKIDEYDRQISVLKSHLGSEKIDDLKAKEAQFESEKNERVNEMKRRASRLVKEIKAKKAEIGEDFSEALDAAVNACTEIEAAKENTVKALAAKSYERDQAKKKLQKYEDLSGGGDCAECEQMIDDNHIKRLREHAKTHYNLAKKQAETLNKAHLECMEQVTKINQDIRELREKVANNKALAKEILTLGKRLKEAKSDLDNAKDEVNPYQGMIVEEEARQKKIKKKLRELRLGKKKIDYLLPYLLFWERGFSDKGLKSFLFDSMCAELTNRSNEYINVLTEGEMTISFMTQSQIKTGELREKFECVIHIDGEDVPYAAYSGGEKTRISLAVDLALADLMNDFYGSHFNFLVMDEQDIYMDDAGRRAYIELLKEQSKNRKVFVVAHDAGLKSEFDDVIKIRRKGTGASQIS